MGLRRVLLIVASFLLAPVVSAEGFANPYKGYSFDVPANWRLSHPDYMLTGPRGESLSESDLPPKGERTLLKISKSAGMIACIGADYEDTNEQFELDGENWKGLVRVFVEPRRTNRQQRHVLQLVAQHGENYRLFYLAIPTQEWISDRDSPKRVLAALKFQQP
ncbi:MAG: hypothetical protein K0Q76_1855 [Panacagrimonas sp.]|jgi:hypothetical protein|nr:hypothetical protein [Panacagrimonas sp.]MCC2656747.1 hypothetical protein [Panacagrimonas sp.]